MSENRFDKNVSINLNSNIPKVYKGKEYNWQHNNVFCDDKPLDTNLFETYTKEEFDNLILNKANKCIPTQDNNVAFLNNVDGDLVDSGQQLEDIEFDIINNGIF